MEGSPCPRVLFNTPRFPKALNIIQTCLTHSPTVPGLAGTHETADRLTVISMLFSETAQKCFIFQSSYKWKMLLNSSVRRFCVRTLYILQEKLFLKAFPLTVSSKRDYCSFWKLTIVPFGSSNCLTWISSLDLLMG